MYFVGCLQTAEAIYNRVAQILSGMVGDNMTIAKLAMGVIGMSDANAFMHFMREMKVELCISTCPVNGKYNPIVLWGMSTNVVPNTPTDN